MHKGRKHSPLSIAIMIALSVAVIYTVVGAMNGEYANQFWVKFTVVSYCITAVAWCFMDESIK